MNITPIDILEVLQEDWVMAGQVEPGPMSVQQIIARHMEKTGQQSCTDAELDNLERLARGHISSFVSSGTISYEGDGLFLTDAQEKWARSQLKGRAIDVDDEGQSITYAEMIEALPTLNRNELVRLIKQAIDLLGVL